MTSEKLKPARDVWLIDEKDRRISGVVIAEPTGNGGNSPVAIVLTKSGHGNARLAKARAEFIAEAGTVFHECGLSPRELLEAVRELHEALATIYDQCGGYVPDTYKSAWSQAFAALAKHKEV